MFEWREKHMLDAVGRRMRRAMSDGEDAFDIFNAVQDHVLLAAQAHIDREVLELFVQAIDRCPDEQAAALLNELCDLHVLSLLERERGWFLEHGRLTPPRAVGVPTAVNDLCRRLRPQAELLVDAWGIPDPILAA